MAADNPIVRDNPSPVVWRARIPLISTSFAHNLWYYALLWPVWWFLGIEQFLLPIFALYETARLLIDTNWRIRVNTTALLAILLALWWIIPIFWVDRAFMDIFLKETATIWSQALLLILFWNRIKTRRDWLIAGRALVVAGFYSAAAGIIFLSGIWQGSFTSVVGRALPQSVVSASSFFSSITIRNFGSLSEEVGLLPYRVMSFSLSFTSLSMICLLLIPFIYWQSQTARGAKRLFYLGIVGGLLLSLFYTESRISYLAFSAAAALYVVLRLGLLRGSNRPLTIALALGGIGLALLVGYIAVETIIQSIQSTFVDLRPGSWLVRLNIYLVTFRLLPEHWIAGWGLPVRLPNTPSDYSAGTHSSYLGLLFQHGIIGLLVYLAIWVSIWKSVFHGLSRRLVSRESHLFWIAMATAFFAFNIREVADSWWWDQSLTFVLWTMWGLVLTVPEGQTDKGASSDGGH